jgi:hypothetical protein
VTRSRIPEYPAYRFTVGTNIATAWCAGRVLTVKVPEDTTAQTELRCALMRIQYQQYVHQT